RSPSYFVERDEPVVEVKGGVFHPLRHDGPGVLLELLDKRALGFMIGFADRVWVCQQQDIADRLENRGVDCRFFTLGACDRLFDQSRFSCPDTTISDIVAVDGKTGDNLANGMGEAT